MQIPNQISTKGMGDVGPFKMHKVIVKQLQKVFEMTYIQDKSSPSNVHHGRTNPCIPRKLKL